MKFAILPVVMYNSVAFSTFRMLHIYIVVSKTFPSPQI